MSPKLEFRLSPPLDDDAPTYAAFSIQLDGKALWPVAGDEQAAVEVFIDDILDHLADFWLPLMLRQTYPIAFDEPPERPTSLAAVSGQRWLKTPEAQVEAEQALVEAFEEAHNLATCFDGQFGLPALWLLRDRDQMMIDTEARLCRVDFHQAIQTLVTLGDTIAARLEAIGPRRKALVDAWRLREQGAGARMLELSAGLSASKAEALLQTRYLSAPKALVDAANDDDEILIAARVAGALPLEDIKRVIKLARAFDAHPAERLDQLGRDTRQHLASNHTRLKPHELGEAAARFVRVASKRDIHTFLDIRALATELEVEVKELGLSFEAILGLAVTGRRHGPGVLLNRRSYRLLYAAAHSREAMLRYTLAHELCHLLLDGGHAFTAVDVLQGRMHPALESRAQSFAGELLLPTRVAASIWENHGRPASATGLDAAIREAVEVCQVTRSVAAWKIEHAANAEETDLHAVLGALARYR